VSKKQSKQPAPKPLAQSLTESEWAIMQVVWDKAPCAAGTVQEALQASHGWAYSTVKTTMDRMCAKGILDTHSIRNLQLFTPAMGRDEARINEFQRFLKRAFDGAVAPMFQFLVEHQGLSDTELDNLRKLIRKSADKKSAENT
jgi:BlaI family penicillinase repressor